MKERRPIFYDAERVRWRRTRRVLEITAALLTLLLAYFFVTIAVSVELPVGLLPDTRPTYRALKLKLKPKTANTREGRHRRIANIGTVPASYDPLRAAFFVSWDSNSLASLKKHFKDIDLLLPEQLHSVTADGGLTVVDYERYETVKVSPEEAIARLKEDKLHQWMKSANVELPMMGVLNNYDGSVWHIKEMVQMLASETARENLVHQVVAYAVEAHQAGILVDFEEMPTPSQPHFQEFIAELGPALHSVGLKLMIALPGQDDEYDYKFFGKQTDAVVLMNYDQHWLNSEPGPIAAQDWFVENLRTVMREVPAQKIIVGIANYAYDWSEAPKKAHEMAQEFSVQEALLHAYESEAQVEFDPTSLNPHYSYSDDHDHVHQVWMLDAITAYNALRAAERLGVQGTALWRLGSSDTSLWPVWDATRPSDAARLKLTDLPPGPDLILEGSGDVWHFVDTPKNGRRSFTYDPASDLFTGEKYEAYPLSYDIDQIGAAKKKLAITFDDGPDPRWTPKILDILKEKSVPATFFVIGVDASQSPELLRREYAEGHEIGNHTYTHPNFDEISHTQLRWELNLTERLIESTLGVKSILFRPPYGVDHQPEYAEEVSQLPVAQDMGYVIVGQKVDPHDWQQPFGKQIPAQQIFDGVLQQASTGNIILFHDGGGDRSQTVAALPRIIDALRAKGYQFVSVPDLIGRTRAQVMIPLSPSEKLEAHADGFIFGLYHWFRLAIATVFILGIVLVSGRALIIGLLALVEKLRKDHDVMPNPPPGVTVLIPAHNEESVILQTVKSVLASDFPNLRVIVVNDGSADRTGEMLDDQYGADARVHIIHQVNRGKSAALSRALGESTTEIVVTIDADTEVEPNAISKLVRHFSDPKTGAVAGNVKVGNRSRWLTRWQALEYITSQNMEKRAFDLLNCITVVPGALGAWRKAAIDAAGGITADTVAEDADLTIAIRRLGWRISYDEEAIAWTEAPETPEVLIRQRFRWTFGTLQSFWKHSDTLFRPKQGTLGWIALPNIFLFQLVLPLVSPLIDLLFLGSILMWALQKWHVSWVFQIHSTTEDLMRSVLFFLAFLLIDVLTCVIAFALERKEDWTLLVPVLLQRFYYRQLMYVVLFRSVKEAVSGRPVGWRGVEPEAPRTVAPA
ncbi:MAG TPA: glycosyltransferase [Candidatus Acidoferrum sp.]|jgi:cellulose synthase/poly-beta-1,6-N-acetylglucosamine synthase-like glycosyltransferase/peptidoglycan/xylan/chitin deacetylase (PgdA/CDA1 family)/spore germination protein YaaH